MSIRKTNFLEGDYHHVYNRGNSKQKIFHDKQDYKHFVDLLYLLNTKENLKIFHLKRSDTFSVYEFDIKDNLVLIGAYCLMPNHFHILITQNENGDVSKFMQKVTTAYVMYYNKKYKRTGSLFEGKFKSKHINKDTYLKYLFSYIHLNIIKLLNKNWKENGIQDKKQALDYLKKYEYSSYLDYLGIKRDQNKILDVGAFPKYFPEKEYLNQEIFDWLSYKDL